MHAACSHLHCAFSIYGSKVRAHYRSTLFADLNLEITVFILFIYFSYYFIYFNQLWL